MSEAPKRLSKVAREFNVGISTIVDFLASKGFEVDQKPNTKISGEMYGLLMEEYMPDKAAKEKSQELKMNKVVRETITIEDQQKEDRQRGKEPEQEEILIKNVGASPIVPSKEESAPAAESAPAEEPAPVEEPKKPEAVKEEKVAETEAPAAETTEPAEQPAEETDAPAEEGGPQVVGKIDLDKLNLKSRPDPKKKKETPAKEEADTEAKKPAEEPAEKPAPEAEEAKPKEAEAVPKEGQEFIETKYEKLDGPRVVGKIELPAEQPKKKKPVASSSEKKGEDKKKKRKRITPSPTDQRKSGPGAGSGARGGGKPQRGRRPERAELSEEAIQKEIKETLARLSGGGKSKSSKLRREKRQAQAQQREEELAAQEAEKQVLKVTEFVTANELAAMMNVSVTEVISACLSLGLMVSINQRLDAETLQVVAEEFGYEINFVTAEEDETEVKEEETDKPEDLESRPPIVTVMGHVDHGKTSLLDYVRKANVIAGEAGGITQHIGAYNVTVGGEREITFLDTPGHEAFTAMRARGAQVTDIVIIVIAADDSVMPQTKEAINHAQAAGVPIVFAFNKVDKPGANADKIREELSTMGLLTEDWGGKFQAQEISAKTGQGVEELLEKVLLEAELLELKANPKRYSEGTVIEASLDKGRGYVTTLLVQTGTLRIGDLILAGSFYGRVKAMFDERGNKVDEAGPSHPVSMLGFNGAPNAGDKFKVYEDEREAKQIATKREQLMREQGIRTTRHITLDEIGRRLAIGDFQELNIIVKGDVDGSVEALADSLLKLSTESIQVNTIHKSVGQITESDVLLASASDAIIVGFQVRPSPGARKLAEREEIDIRLYSVIYDAIEEVRDAMEGMLKPKTEEKVVCNLEVRETFRISKVGTIAGCYVLDGKINRNTRIRLIRDGVVVYTGELGSLKRFKDDVREVSAGYECGLNIQNFNDIKVGDQIEGFEEIEVKQTL